MLDNYTPIIHDFGSLVHDDEMVNFKDLVGTPGYIAPEVMDGRNYTKYADLHALGVLIAEIVNKRAIYFTLD